MTYLHVEQVDDMIKAWQAECADHPALYNQGNVLRDRLAKLTADIELPVDDVAVSGWGVWSGQAIEPKVARHIAGKINSLISAAKAEGGSVAVADLERSVMVCATLADLRTVQITIQRIHEAEGRS